MAMTREQADKVFVDIEDWFAASEYHDIERSLSFEHRNVVLRVAYDDIDAEEVEAAARGFAENDLFYPVSVDGKTVLEVWYPFETNQPESLFAEIEDVEGDASE